MSIKIGHASIDENSKAKNGQAGDQTGKEVCIRTWYSKPWQFVLRCKDSDKAELMAQACEAGCNNPNIGYDQNQRNTLSTEAKKVGYKLQNIETKCECDCSSFMTVCAQAAGINIPYNVTNAPTTSTMKTAFTSTGLFDVLTSSKYLTSDAYLKRGDILVKPGSHTVMALENGGGINGNVDINIIYKELSSTSHVSTTPTSNVFIGKVTTSSGNLNIRQGPGTNYPVVGSLPKGKIVQVNGVMNDFYMTIYGFVSKDYISQAVGQVYNCTALNMRSTPIADPTNKNVVKTLNVGDEIALLSEQGNWYQGTTSDGVTGWVSKSYIKVL